MEMNVRLDLQHYTAQSATRYIEEEGDVMSCQIIEQPSIGRIPLWGRVIAGTIAALTFRRRRIGRIEFEDMPDRVKRDMGFLDGREPYREEDYLPR
jgi:hypothetical protein